MFYCAFQKRSNSEVQKPTNVCVFAAVNHPSGPLKKPKLYFNTSSWLFRSRVCVLLKSAVIPAIFPFLSGPPKDGKREGKPSAAIMPSTNRFIFGLTKPTLLWLNSLDFRSSSSSSLEKNVSLGISSNSLPSLLGLEPIRCKRDWTAKEAAEARGALDRAAPGHQVSRL